MKKLTVKRGTIANYATYLCVTIAFVVLYILQQQGGLSSALEGQLVPICCYIVMAVSLNLTVGILGELSLGHAGFMGVGAFAGIIAAQSLAASIPLAPVRLAIAMVVGAICAAVAGFLVGIPVLRLRGDYLAIVTLAFGEIIKEIINCLLVGYDENGLHIAFNIQGTMTMNDLGLTENGVEIIKGAQGAMVTKIASFPAGFILILITLFVVLNLMRSRSGRAIMAVRDNRIAAESVGIPITKYKLMAFVVSAALAGAAGALYGTNYATLVSSKFDFNTSILVLVYVVLGGLGNIWGSIIATAVLYILPEIVLRTLGTYRMLAYAILLILVMLATNNPILRSYFRRIGGALRGQKKEAADHE